LFFFLRFYLLEQERERACTHKEREKEREKQNPLAPNEQRAQHSIPSQDAEIMT